VRRPRDWRVVGERGQPLPSVSEVRFDTERCASNIARYSNRTSLVKMQFFILFYQFITPAGHNTIAAGRAKLNVPILEARPTPVGLICEVK